MSAESYKLTFNHASLAARKARFSLQMTSTFRVVLAVVAGLFLLAGTSLWVSLSAPLGGLLVGVGALIIVPLLWLHYDMGRTRPVFNAGSEQTVKLETSMSADVVGRLRRQPSHYDVWMALKPGWTVRHFLIRFGLSISVFEESLSKEYSEESFHLLMQRSYLLSKQMQSNHMSSVSLLVALLESLPNYDSIIAAAKLDSEDVMQGIRWAAHEQDVANQIARRERVGGIARDWTSGFTPTLNLMATNISATIEHGAFAHISTTTHEKTINEMLLNLVKPRSNVMLVGEVGSGKTICTHALAKHLLQDVAAPKSIRFFKVYQVSASAIISSSTESDRVESTLYSVINEAAKARDIVLFFDNAINLFTTAQGAVDLRRAVLDIIKNSPIPIILEMTNAEWQQVSHENQELAGLINVLMVPESDESATMDILQDHCIGLEAQYGVVVTYRALQESISLAGRYVEGQVQPGRAITVLESAVGHAEGHLVTETSVAQAIEAMYGVKVQIADATEGKELLSLEDRIHERMINQTRAVKVVSDALRRARSGVGNPERPIGTFLFLGPTGVGKTELSKALSEVYFGDERKIIRVDMNEYTQSSDLGRLLDSQTQTSLLSSVGRDRFSVVLFDEIEKAHPDVVNAFLQLLDEGQMRDASNRVISFRDTIVIATSNAGADRIRTYIEQGKEVEQFEQDFINELINASVFRPEFLNRFDEIVVFRPLKVAELLQVTDILIAEVNKTLAHQKVSVALTDEAKSWLVAHGNDPRLGARPLRRVVQRTVENIVAKKVLSGELAPGSLISLGVPDLEAE